jgi:hypothetical protein
VPRGQRDDSQRPYFRVSRPQPLLFLPSSSSVALTMLSGPRSKPTTSTGNIKKKFLGSKVRPVHRADNLTAIYESIV